MMKRTEGVEPEYQEIDWDTTRGEGRYPFYMEKEIMEQPDTIRRTLAGRIKDGHISLEKDGVPDQLLADCQRICVVACGTAMHVGQLGSELVRKILHMHMDVEYASEFMYMDPVIDEKTLVLAISQSEETIDTLEALKYARRQGARSIGVINVRGSSIAREKRLRDVYRRKPGDRCSQHKGLHYPVGGPVCTDRKDGCGPGAMNGSQERGIRRQICCRRLKRSSNSA